MDDLFFKYLIVSTMCLPAATVAHTTDSFAVVVMWALVYGAGLCLAVVATALVVASAVIALLFGITFLLSFFFKENQNG